MKNRTILFIALFLSVLGSVNAQEAEQEADFFTGISPVILSKGQAEFNFMNTLTSFRTTTSQYLPSVDAYRVTDRRRYSRFDQMLRVTYGFSESKKWDLGVEMRFAHARYDEAARSSPFAVLGGETPTGKSYHGFALLGLRARAMLFPKLPELTLQATVHYPMARPEEKAQGIGTQQTQAGFGATYFVQSGGNLTYFFQADWTTRFGVELEKQTLLTNHLISAATYMVVRIYENQWYFFPSASYGVATRITNGGFRRINQQILGGLGVFYQPAPQFSILLNWNIPFLLTSGSSLTTFDRESYTGVTLGLRTLLN